MPQDPSDTADQASNKAAKDTPARDTNKAHSTQKTHEDKAAKATSNDQVDFIDAEIIDPPKSESASPRSPQDKTPKKRNWSAILGWSIAALSTAFIGGVVAAPTLRSQLEAVGLIAPLPLIGTSATGGDAASRQFVDSLVGRVAALEQRLEALNSNGALSGDGSATTGSDFSAFRDQTLAELDALKQQLERATNTQPQSVSDGEPSTTPASDLATDVEREALLSRLAQLENQQQSAVNSIASLSRTLSALTDVDQAESTRDASPDPAVLEVRAALMASKADATAQAERIQNLEAQIARLSDGALMASPRGRLLVAALRVEEKLDAGQPFLDELAALEPDIDLLPLRDQTRLAPALNRLKQISDKGVTPIERLRADFATTVADLLKAAPEAKQFGGLFSVRRLGTEATGLDAAIRSAELRLVAGDLAGVIAEMDAALKDADPSMQAIFRDWRQTASDYQQVHDDYRMIRTHLLSQPLDARVGNRQSRSPASEVSR